MEKFLRYLLVLISAILAVLLFYPFDGLNKSRYTPAKFYTPIDGTAISSLARMNINAARYWEMAFRHRWECKIRNKECEHPFRLDYFYAEMRFDVAHFDRVTTGNSSSLLWDTTMLFHSCLGKEQKGDCEKSLYEKTMSLGEPVYERYLEERRKHIRIITWVANILAALLIVLLFLKRGSVARFICGILWGSGRGLRSVANKIHDQV